MRLPDPPDGLIVVPIPKAILLLTAREYIAGIRRGKWWRRRQAMLSRAAARQEAPESTIGSDPISP